MSYQLLTDVPLVVRAVAEEAIALHMEWLNRHMEYNSPEVISEFGPLTRASYDEYGDSPCLVCVCPSLTYDETRMVILRVSPYHDEGGPSELYCFVEWDWSGSPREYHGLQLNKLTTMFDTDYTEVWGSSLPVGFINKGNPWERKGTFYNLPEGVSDSG